MKLMQRVKKSILWRVLRKIRYLPNKWWLKKYEKKFDGKPFTTDIKKEIQELIKKRRNIYFRDEKTSKNIAENWKGEINKPQNLRYIENAVPVVLSSNEKFVSYTAVMLQSLLDNSNPQRKYHFILFERDFSEKTKYYLVNQISEFQHCSIDFINVTSAFNEIPIASPSYHFSIDTYSRLFVPYWLDCYQKVIYCDSDMIAKADIAELYDLDIQDRCIGVVVSKAGNYLFKRQNYSSILTSTPSYMFLDDWSCYFNAGLLIFNTEKFKEKLSYQDLFKFSIYFSNCYKNHYNDQDVLNLLLNKDDYFALPPEWNYEWHIPSENGQSYQASAPNTKIIHFTGNIKPWKDAPEIVNNSDALSYRNYAIKVPLYNIYINKID